MDAGFRAYLLSSLIRRDTLQSVLATVAAALERQGISVSWPEEVALDVEPVASVLRPKLRPGVTVWAGWGGEPSQLFVGVDHEEPNGASKRASLVETATFASLATVEARGTAPLFQAAVSVLVAAALDACAGIVPEDAPCDVRVGLSVASSGTSWLLGRLTDEGFVPTPLPVARVSEEERRRATERWLIEHDAPAEVRARTLAETDYPVFTSAFGPTRRMVHPDGRTWELRAREGAVDLRAVDEEGDAFERTLTGLGKWEIEAMVASRARDGFREL